MRVWEDKEKEEVKYHRGPMGVNGDEMLKKEEMKQEKDDDEAQGEVEVDEVEGKVEGESANQATTGEDGGDIVEDDDEAWEEKVRKQIEGEED